MGQREFARLVKAVGVKPITFHGMRHTCATLLLQAGEPVKTVSERLGHKKPQEDRGNVEHLRACPAGHAEERGPHSRRAAARLLTIC
jgi:integrase